MKNETVLERTSNLVMPSHYVELIEEEMCYVDGGYDYVNTYTGADGWGQVAKFAGLSVVAIIECAAAIGSLVASSGISCLWSTVGVITGLVGSVFNIYNTVAGLVSMILYGNVKVHNYGWWIFNFETVIF